MSFRAVREGFCCLPPRLAADRSRSARGIVVIAFNARFGPVSLPLGAGWVFWEADVLTLRGSSSGGVVGDGAWLRGILAVSTVPHGVF